VGFLTAAGSRKFFDPVGDDTTTTIAMATGLVDINGIDKVALLRAMFESKKPVSFSRGQPGIELGFDHEEAKVIFFKIVTRHRR
jgi:hypothetical protein